MQADCISVSLSSLTSDEQFAEPSDTLMFIDWDDMLFPTTEIFEHWRVPTDSKRWRGFTFSSAQCCLLDSWRDAAYQYLSTSCSLSERCVIVTNSKRRWIKDCIDFFAPNIRVLLDSSDGPRIVYADDADDDETDSEDEHEVESADSHRSHKLAVMRREAKDFCSKYADQKCKDESSASDMTCELDACPIVSLAPGSKSVGTAVAPSISQMTARMRSDCQFQFQPLAIKCARDKSSARVQREALAAVLDCDRPVTKDRRSSLIPLYGRSKPQYMDFSHRQELREFKDELLEIA